MERKRVPRAKEGYEIVRGDDEATWHAFATFVTGSVLRARLFLEELDRWRWDVVEAVVGRWQAVWQDAEDAFSAFVVAVAAGITGGQAPESPRHRYWLPFLARRVRNRLYRQRPKHLPVNHTEREDGDDDAVIVADRQSLSPSAALELEDLLTLLRPVLTGERGSELHFRVVAGRMLGLDYEEIGGLLHRSPRWCRVAHSEALKRIPDWLLARITGGRRRAA